MRIRKTRSGKVSLTKVSAMERERLWLILRDATNRGWRVGRGYEWADEPLVKMYYLAMHELWMLVERNRYSDALTINMSAAVALMICLRNHDDLELLDIKSQLHKIL